jgi:hypothetical protein
MIQLGLLLPNFIMNGCLPGGTAGDDRGRLTSLRVDNMIDSICRDGQLPLVRK